MKLAIVAPKSLDPTTEVMDAIVDWIVMKYGEMPTLVVGDGSDVELEIAEMLTGAKVMVVKTDWDKYKVDGMRNPAANIRNVEIARVADELLAIDSGSSNNVFNLIRHMGEVSKPVNVVSEASMAGGVS